MSYKVLLQKNKEKPNILVEKWTKDMSREFLVGKIQMLALSFSECFWRTCSALGPGKDCPHHE